MIVNNSELRERRPRTPRGLRRAAAGLAALAAVVTLGGALTSPAAPLGAAAGTSLGATADDGARILRSRPAQAAAASNTGSHAFSSTNSVGPAHWDRCTTIRYWVNPVGMPRGALTDVATAFGKLSAASGLRFTYAGATTVVPLRAGWTSALPTTARSDIYLSWSTEAVHPALAGTVAGLGGTAWTTPAGREPRVVIGGVVIDQAASMAAGFGPGVTRGALLLHELGHVANLAHVSATTQTMYPSITSASRGDYQSGDRAGLGVLRARPCF